MTFGSIGMRKLGAAAGVVAPILAFACILLAIASYPQFSWTNNALSDLGVVKGSTGPLFNFGLYASGFLGLIFAAFGLFSYIGKSVVGKVGSLFFCAASLMLVAIGVFNESFSGTHYVVSASFFVLTPISLFILAFAFAQVHHVKLALFSVSVGVVAAVPWILEFIIHYVPEVAVPETISGLAVSAWIIVIGYSIFRQTKN